MWIVRLALNCPYTFVVAAIVRLLLTPFLLLRTPTDVLPAIKIPVVSVVWLDNGLSAKEMEDRVIYNHERMISAQVFDIEHVESTSYNGAGVIKIFFQPDASIAEALSQITASCNSVMRLLPPGRMTVLPDSDLSLRIPVIPATDSEGRRPPIPEQGGRFLSERSDAGFS